MFNTPGANLYTCAADRTKSSFCEYDSPLAPLPSPPFRLPFNLHIIMKVPALLSIAALAAALFALIRLVPRSNQPTKSRIALSSTLRPK